MVKAPPQPVPLVTEEQGTYATSPEGLQFLERLDEEYTFGVVAVAGRYRSGKSFLLNRGLLEAPPKKGFATGNSINACTRGIWILPACLDAFEKRCFLVLDTEGTASMEARAEHDAQLIGIALALASVFVFNSSGAIDETSLSDLATLTTVAQGISSQNSAFSPPTLLWVLRDFSLELRGDQGEELRPDEYLERALSEERYGKAAVRAQLKGFFRQRKMLPLVRPCLEESQLQKLNTLSNAALRPQFLAQLEGFRKEVRLAASKPKELGGLALNGRAIAQLAREAVSATNQGKAPVVQTIFDALQERRIKEAKEEATKLLRAQALATQQRMPLSELPSLEAPPLPAFLSSLPEARRLFEEELTEEGARLRADLVARNDARAREWMEEQLRSSAQEGLDVPAVLAAWTQRLPRELLPGALVRLFEVACLQLAARLAEHEERSTELHSELARTRQRADREADVARELRQELEDALLNTAPCEASEARARAVEDQLHETREEARAALSALSRSRDELRQEASALALELGAQQRAAGSEVAQACSRAEELSSELEASLAEQAELRRGFSARAQTDEMAVRASLEELRLEFAAIVRSCDARAAAMVEQRDAARAEAGACEEALAEGEARVQRERQRLDEERASFAADLEQQRKQQTQELLQRKQLLTEAYSAIAQDSQRCRDAAAASDRKLMVVEVERESLKRRLEILEAEGEELRKLRRQYEEVRFKQASTEASLQASERLQQMKQAQLLSLEEDLKKLRASAQEKDFELLKKTAMLELQLQAQASYEARK